jgi:hypothetical protein
MTKPTLPPLGSAERYEIETIYDRLFDGGYDLVIGYSGSGWFTALHQHGLPGSSVAAREGGCKRARSRQGHLGHVPARPDAERGAGGSGPPARRSDRYVFLENGTVMIRRGIGDSPWLVRWMPNEKAGIVWPPARLSAEEADYPTDEGVAGVLRWVLAVSGEAIRPSASRAAAS